MSKQLSSVSICRAQVFAGFSGHGDSIHNVIPLLIKENVDLCRELVHIVVAFWLVNACNIK